MPRLNAWLLQQQQQLFRTAPRRLATVARDL